MNSCVSFVSSFFVYFRVMATFNVLDEDDYGDIFITQEPSDSNIVSLEDNSLMDAKYSDISDFEEDPIEERLR